MFATERGSRSRRRTSAVGAATAAAVLAGVAALSGAGQTPREWRDYAGGPDSSRFVAATADRQGQRGPAGGGLDLPGGRHRLQPSRRARCRLQPDPRHRARGARRGHREGALGARRHRRLRASRRELLGERRRRGSPPAVQCPKHAARHRRADRQADRVIWRQRSRRPAARASIAIPRRSSSRADCQGRCSRTSSSWARRPTASTRRRRATSAPSTCARARWSGPSGPIPAPASSAPTRGPTTRAPQSAAPTTGRELSVDPARGIVYVPTGSAKYNFYGGYRHGDNLFANCILALDARTGRRLWHFQMVHHDIWDVDNNSAPQLTTVRHDGRTIDVVAGRVEDRLSLRVRSRDGQPIWPIVERPVPQDSHVPGEQLSPTQPFPTNATAVRAAIVQRRRSESVHPERRGTRPVAAAPRARAQRRPVHADRFRRGGAHAGQPGRVELGQHGHRS